MTKLVIVFHNALVRVNFGEVIEEDELIVATIICNVIYQAPLNPIKRREGSYETPDDQNNWNDELDNFFFVVA